MSERRRFIMLCLLLMASIGLLLIITNSIDQSFIGQF
jgi:hypothetical protein